MGYISLGVVTYTVKFENLTKVALQPLKNTDTIHEVKLQTTYIEKKKVYMYYIYIY